MGCRFNRNMNNERSNLISLIGVILALAVIGTVIFYTSDYPYETTQQEKKIEIEKSEESEKTGRLILIDKYYDRHFGNIYTFYDSDNYVMYSSIERSGLVQLVNPDGSPKIYNP